MSESRPGEAALIARYFAPLAGPGTDSLRDDAASLTPSPGHDLVVTTDAVVAGIHYFAEDPPASIARKALGVNLSDLAAKGARPRGYLLTLALAPDWTPDWLSAFAAGLGRAAAEADCPLLGGDTVRTVGPAMISVTAFGEVPTGTMVPRRGARPGDRLLVSGTVGDAALGLALRLDPNGELARGLGEAEKRHLLDRYLHPQPRSTLAEALRQHARAAMDVSDGLAGDLAKMLGDEESASLHVRAIPLSQAATFALSLGPAQLDTVLTGGDDYEILCAVAPERLPPFRSAAAQAGVPVTEIGVVRAGAGTPVFVFEDGTARSYERGSFSHF